MLAVRTLDPLFLAAEDEYDIPETVDPQRASSFDLDDSSPISTPSTPTNCSTPNALLGDYALSASSSSPLVDQLDVHGSKSTSPLDSSISSASSSSSSSDSFKPQRRPTPSPSSQIRFLQDEVVELEKIFHVTLSESLAISMVRGTPLATAADTERRRRSLAGSSGSRRSTAGTADVTGRDKRCNRTILPAARSYARIVSQGVAETNNVLRQI